MKWSPVTSADGQYFLPSELMRWRFASRRALARIGMSSVSSLTLYSTPRMRRPFVPALRILTSLMWCESFLSVR